jgi:NADH-quinone oxidoreductase subunit N
MNVEVNANLTAALGGFVVQLLPEVVLCLAACLLFLGATFRIPRTLWGVLTLGALAGAAVALMFVRQRVPFLDQAGEADLVNALRYAAPVTFTPYALLFKNLALITGALLVLLGWDEGGEQHSGEYFGCLLLITAGMSLAASANDLITLFVALELVSIPTYMLLYVPRVTPTSQEAAMKYFMLSIFSSALLLFGFSYLYGLTGTMNIPSIVETLSSGQASTLKVGSAAPWRGMVLVALVMIVAGLGFKITAVPFHFYAPDVYQGTTTPSAAMLAFVPKVVGFAALIKLLGFTGSESTMTALGTQVPVLLWIMAAVTMTLGNILALWQTNLKRLLAYSSVAHAGYMLIGLAVAPRLANSSGGGSLAIGGVEATLFYLGAYGAMTLGTFAVLHLLSQNGRTVETEDDLVGLGKTHPVMALVMTLFLLSLIGIPLTAGFAGKALLFFDALGVNSGKLEGLTREQAAQAAEQARLYGYLALIGAINAAIAAWYYLRLLSAMYLREAIEPLPKLKLSPAVVTVALCAALTVTLGVAPRVWLDPVQQAVRPKQPVPGQARAADVPVDPVASR